MDVGRLKSLTSVMHLSCFYNTQWCCRTKSKFDYYNSYTGVFFFSKYMQLLLLFLIIFCMFFLFQFTGLSVFYFLLLLFILFQNRRDVRLMIEWLYPDLVNKTLAEKVGLISVVVEKRINRTTFNCDIKQTVVTTCERSMLSTGQT